MRTSIIAFLILVGLAGNLSAQEIETLDYFTVDSTSYALYSTEQWKSLRKLGHEAEASGFDFYYLNFRVGVANYKTGHFHAAEKHFLKAHAQNPAIAAVSEYLFWIYSSTGRIPEAAKFHNLLPAYLKSTTPFDISKGVKSVYIEMGPKVSDDAELAGTLLYGKLGSRYRFSKKISVYYEYNYMENDLVWGDFKQHSTYLAPTLTLKNGWIISAGINYFNYSRNFEQYFESDSTVYSTFTDDLSFTYDVESDVTYSTKYAGQFKENALALQLNATKIYRNFSLSPHISVINEWNSPDFDEINSSEWHRSQYFFNGINSSTDSTVYIYSDTLSRDSATFGRIFQAGTSFDYTHRFNDVLSFTLGAEVRTVFLPQDPQISFAPYFSSQIGPRLGISGYYTSKGNYPVSMFGGSLIFNSYDKLNSRLSITARYNLTDKFSLYATGFWDDIEDGLAFKSYNSYSMLTGLNIKL